MNRSFHTLFLTLILSVIAGCSGLPNETVSQIERDCDRVEIRMFKDTMNDEVIHKVSYSKKEKIEEVLEVVSNWGSKYYKCGYDGEILFFDNSEKIIWEGVFNIECGHIVDDKESREISKKGLVFLSQLKEELTKSEK